MMSASLESGTTYNIISPVDNTIYKTITYNNSEATASIKRSHKAFQTWKTISLDVRISILSSFITNFLTEKDEICQELMMLIGRPLQQNYNELKGFEERARYMIDIARDVLNPTTLEPQENLKRFIKREPKGAVLIIAPWNYPYMCMVNSVIPALLAGNTVLMKQHPQTMPCAKRFLDALLEVGLPFDVFQSLEIDHSTCEESILKNPLVSFVQFTGSVKGGSKVHTTTTQNSSRFNIQTGLELGGKDPAYVRQDADISKSIEGIIDGAFYNSGQSCCAVERVYVHESVFDEFVEKAVSFVNKTYKLGDPRIDVHNLGPVISVSAAEGIKAQIKGAIENGAKGLIDESNYKVARAGSAYVAPQLLVDVKQDMEIMQEETFGPVVGILKVSNDEEAIKFMNDSKYGLTASVWTRDEKTFLKIADELETGTVYMNRCDYLDPGLAWVGVKNSGIGCSLSKYGFDAFTRPKSFNMKLAP